MSQKTSLFFNEFVNLGGGKYPGVSASCFNREDCEMSFVYFQDHIYKLMRSDSYTRFIKSDQYKELLAAKRKVRLINSPSSYAEFIFCTSPKN